MKMMKMSNKLLWKPLWPVMTTEILKGLKIWKNDSSFWKKYDSLFCFSKKDEPKYEYDKYKPPTWL